MTAKIKPRINLKNRTKLEEVIPLSTPYILFVDPSNICNFKCRFCPNGYPELIKRKQTFLDFNLYKKIIDDLKEFDKPLKVLRLYKDGEPFLNKRFPDMIKYSKENNIANSIDTTTNGYLLTPKLNKSLIESGLDRINISVNGLSNKQFLEFTRVKVNFTKYVENIKHLYRIKKDCEICVKITGDFLTEQQKGRFLNIFKNCADRIFIENIAPCWTNFDVEKRLNINITKGIYNNPISEVDVCPYIFYSFTINSDGTASLCFLDWEHKLIIGDVKIQSIKDIWESNILLNHQIENLNGRRKLIDICKDCKQLSHCLPDNIDKYKNMLLLKMFKSIL